MTPYSPNELQRSENLMALIISETHIGNSLMRTESFCDLIRTGLGLLPDALQDEEDLE